MGAMKAFLDAQQTPEIARLYEGIDERWDGRADQLNSMLAQQGLPVRVANMSTVWTVLYTKPSRYNWMLQFYLRAHGLAFSWVGSGRLIFSLNYGDVEFAEVAKRFTQAAQDMQDAGWWGGPEQSNQKIRKGIFKEMLRQPR
jgi:glutamate-1-semialdehyde 2,1-aminomutase